MTSPHLQAEKDRLLSHIATIRSSGDVAPSRYFLTTVVTTANSKTYSYARLVRESREGKQDVTSLGREGSAQHQSWLRRIARRDAIVELEQQLKQLEDLTQRQQERSGLVERDLAEPEKS